MKATLFLLVSSVAFFSSSAQSHPEIALESRSTGTGYALCGSCSVPNDVSSTTRLVNKDEPGEHIVLSGRIFKEDGVTPDSGITLFLYQTDSGGYYHRPEENVFHPRIFGWIRTGSDGSYEVHTIRPRSEVLSPKEPGHIHVHIFNKGMPEHFLHEFWFQGDNEISAEETRASEKLGTFSPIVTLEKGSDRLMKGVRNIRVRPAPQWKYEVDEPR